MQSAQSNGQRSFRDAALLGFTCMLESKTSRRLAEQVGGGITVNRDATNYGLMAREDTDDTKAVVVVPERRIVFTAGC